MKRVIVFLVAVSLIMSLCACGIGGSAGYDIKAGAGMSGAAVRRGDSAAGASVYRLEKSTAANSEEKTVEDSLMYDEDVLNVLLIGTDARTADEQARSDVMILFSLNQNTKKIVVTSFMRDIYTEIPGHGSNRLNAPYALEGADCLIETLEADFGVRIDNYAAVTFYGFADIIDAFGGIDLELTNAEVDFINEQTYGGEQSYLGVGTGMAFLEYSSDGMYHLNGTQALAYCRNRSSAGSDFDRTSRQRTMISAVAEKANGLTMKQIISLTRAVLNAISTDLTLGKCLSLVLKSGEYMSYDMEALRIPEDGTYSGVMIDGMAVLSIDFDAASQTLKDTIYG